MPKDLSQFPESLSLDQGTVFSLRIKVVVGILVLLGSLGYLVLMAFQSATVYYYDVGEINQLGSTPEGKMVRVSGKLVPGSFLREGRSIVSRFALTDGSETLPAVHEGVLPDLFFNEHSEVILEGRLKSNGLFESENVIVKCPSKYMAVD